MIFTSGYPLTDLYTRNIIAEHFPECCFSDQNNVECVTEIITCDDSVKARIEINNRIFNETEKFCDHLNNKLAITTAIGKCVISYAKSKSIPISPYGVLTGVRPFKIAIDLISRYEYDKVIKILKNTYLVNEEKTELLLNIAMYDQKIRSSHLSNDVSVYLSIPFCPSKCNYCSFISSASPAKLNLLDAYIYDALKEVEAVSKLIQKNSLNIKSIYIGGGTPTVLDKELLKKLLTGINDHFPVNSLCEFTLEAGRPDTIDSDKLDIMKNYGVTRTCINCQSTSDSVLEAIGRNHNSQQFFDAFDLAKQYDFHTINTDIIAGLDSDTFETFKNTVNDVLSLRPESITVHTLCIKKSSDIKATANINLCKNIDSQIDYSRSECILNGYLPYYLYKQKYALGNQENVGYCLHSHDCYYNIAMMNEIEHIIGIGAGATSRFVGRNSNGKTEHFANYKYPTEYIGAYEKIENNIKCMDKILSTNI